MNRSRSLLVLVASLSLGLLAGCGSVGPEPEQLKGPTASQAPPAPSTAPTTAPSSSGTPDDGADGHVPQPSEKTSALTAPAETGPYWIWGSYFTGDTTVEPVPEECVAITEITGVDMYADGGQHPGFIPSTLSTVIAHTDSIVPVGENEAWQMSYIIAAKENLGNGEASGYAWYNEMDACATAYSLIVPSNDPNWTGAGPSYSWFLVTPPTE